MQEIWKDIRGYEKLYQVSNLGRVKSYPRQGTKGKIIKQWEDKDGYLRVYLRKDGKTKTKTVHRLVANAFLKNPNNLSQINHKREFEKWNNCVSNLEWCTPKYNVNYGTRNERTSKKVMCIETGTIYYSTREAERKTNIYHNQISKCCLGRNKFETAGGYHWKYVS